MAKADKTKDTSGALTDDDIEAIEGTEAEAVRVSEAGDDTEDTSEDGSETPDLDADEETADNDEGATDPETGSDDSETSEDDAEPETELQPDDSDAVDNPDDQPTAESTDAPEQPDPVEEAAKQPPEQAARRQGSSGLVTGFAGGLVAAVAVVGAVQYISRDWPFPSGQDPEIAQIQQDLAEYNSALASLRDDQSALGADIQTLRDASGEADELRAGMQALGDDLDKLQTSVLTLEDRLTDLEKRPIREGVSNAAIQAYERELEALKATVQEQRDEAAAMQERARVNAQQALASAAMARLFSALDSGSPYRAALTDLASATDADIPATLDEHADTGIPTLAALIEAFPEAARRALAEARNAGEAGEDGNRLSRFLRNQLGARSVERREGSGTDAILSRAEDAVRQGALAAALTEIEGLPEAARTAMSDWVAMAALRQDAVAAANALAQTLKSN